MLRPLAAEILIYVSKWFNMRRMLNNNLKGESRVSEEEFAQSAQMGEFGKPDYICSDLHLSLWSLQYHSEAAHQMKLQKTLPTGSGYHDRGESEHR